MFFLIVTVALIAIYHLYLSQNPGVNPAGLYPTLLVLLCLLPVVGLIYAFRAYGYQRGLAQTNEQLARRNERLALQAIASQVTALDLKDNYTARHSASVARWATDIAEHMGLSRSECNLAHLAGLLHDVGKIGVPDEILKSSRRLDAASWSCVDGHCENGYRILRNVEVFGTLAKVVLCHHERYDGSGYPLRLRGEEIPLVSRIICVADSYSAMVSHRPYGPPLSVEEAMMELESNKGRQFDPQVVDAFLAVLSEHDERYRQGSDLDFELEMKRTRFLRELPLEPEEGAGDGPEEDLLLDILPSSELRSHAAADRRAAAARQTERRSSP